MLSYIRIVVAEMRQAMATSNRKIELTVLLMDWIQNRREGWPKTPAL